MVAALAKEMQLQQTYLQEQEITTIYFGGGTPSLLQEAELDLLFNELRSRFPINADAEITLEANPDDVNSEKLEHWKSLGINRLSIGIQSLFEEDLQWMNRAHTATQAAGVIEISREAGFEHFTVDLIYGVPSLSDEKWQQNLEWVVAQGINHLSCYALTVEPRTALDAKIRKQLMQDVDDEQQHRHFNMLLNFAEAAGFEHYEISNFARPGHRSRHNSAYWSGSHYLGIGPSAHSFNGSSRQWNVSNNMQYMRSIEDGKLPFEMEALTQIQQLNEYIMTSLRTAEGCDLDRIRSVFGAGKACDLEKAAQPFIRSGTVIAQKNTLRLTREGKWYADGIAAELFFTE